MQIYVGNLPNGYHLSDLVRIFETYGCVSRASAVRDFAFLSMFDNEAARAAVEGLNGNLYGEKEMVVERARFYARTSFQPTRGESKRDHVNSGEQTQEKRDTVNSNPGEISQPEGANDGHVQHGNGDGQPISRSFEQGGCRGGFRRGRGQRGNQVQRSAGSVELAAEVGTATIQPERGVNGDRNAASDGGDTSQQANARNRGARRGGRGAAVGRGGARGGSQQLPSRASIAVNQLGGSGDNAARNLKQHNAVPQPGHPSAGGEGIDGGKGCMNTDGGAGDMHMGATLRNGLAAN